MHRLSGGARAMRSICVLMVLWVACLWTAGAICSSDNTPEQAIFFDARERVAAQKTLVWAVSRGVVIPNALVDAVAQLALSESGRTEAATPAITLDENIEVAGDAFIAKELHGTYVVARGKNIMSVHYSCEKAVVQVDSTSENLPLRVYIDKSQSDTWKFYSLGVSGEVGIIVSGAFADIFFWGKNGIGIPFPTLGPYGGDLCLLSGISPLRLFGAEPADWRIVSSTEHAWVFEIDPEKAKRLTEPFVGVVDTVQRVVLTLNRLHGDAPEKLEIHSVEGTDVWQVREYKMIEGVWFPSVVEAKYWNGSNAVYQLVETSSIVGEPTIDIPEGLTVRDFRRLRKDVFRSLMSDTFEDTAYRTTWSPKLLADIWREIRTN